MKHILTFLLSIMTLMSLYSQTTPFILKDSSGQEFVILSLDQAQKLDNLSENKCTSIVDSLNNLYLIRNSELTKFRIIENEYKQEIENLRLSIEDINKKCVLEVTRKELQLEALEYEICEKDKKIKYQSGLQKILIAFAAVTFSAFAIAIN